MPIKRSISFLLLFMSFLISKPVHAAELAVPNAASISGYVRDSETEETLIGATVFIEGTRLGAVTNKMGLFTVNNIPPGEYTVITKYLGYKTKELKLSFGKNENVRQTILLAPASISTDVVKVEADRDVEARQISISKVNIPLSQIKGIRVGGESDVLRSLQFLPGILTSSQISSGLYVRGGSPDQNLILLDGTTVYNPTHLFGFISTFNTDAIKDVDLIKGGFPAEYGGRLSAVVNITQKDGNRKDFGGTASLGIISSRLGLEGPIGNGSWFISGRRTYFDLLKDLFPENKERPLPDFGFYDLNGKITQDFGDNDKISVSGFMSSDDLVFGSFGFDLDLSVGNRTLAAKWTHIFSPSLFSTVNVSYSHYFNKFLGDQSGYEFLINNTITDYTAKADFEWFASEDLTVKFGYQATSFNFMYLQNLTGDADSTQSGSGSGFTNFDVNDLHHNLYAQLKYAFNDRLSLQSGLRTNYWELSDLITFDPRVALRYRLFGNVTVKGAFGIFHQSLRLASQPDFSFFDTWLPTDSTIDASKSMHYILTFETEPFDGIDFNFDVYYKTLENITELNTNALTTETVSDVFFVGNGYSYGAEVFFQKRIGRLTGWVGYGLGFIRAKFDSINQGAEFRPKYDRTHDFKVVTQYKIDEHWNVGATFTFQSGQSYTGAVARVQSRLPGQNLGRGKIIESQRYGLRLPPSHQLNVNASYDFEAFGLEQRVILDVYNVYNRADIWFRYYRSEENETVVEDVTLLPIIPTISYEIKF